MSAPVSNHPQVRTHTPFRETALTYFKGTAYIAAAACASATSISLFKAAATLSRKAIAYGPYYKNTSLTRKQALFAHFVFIPTCLSVQISLGVLSTKLAWHSFLMGMGHLHPSCIKEQTALKSTFPLQPTSFSRAFFSKTHYAEN